MKSCDRACGHKNGTINVHCSHLIWHMVKINPMMETKHIDEMLK